jgi:hypothetical protein
VEAARNLVDAWLEAQNTGNFEIYSALYAAKLEGIKRVGAKKSSYDREGWLEDRKRMFGKKIEVKAEDLFVNTAGTTAIARFRQTWSSGNFTDAGPKQLVLVPTEDGPKIAREEMLESVVSGEDGPTKKYVAKEAALMVGDDMVVLGFAPELATTNLRVIDRGGAAIADVQSAGDYASYVGTNFTVERRRRHTKPCSAKVASIHVLAHAVPHFGQVQYWNGEWTDPRMSDSQVAQEIWALADGPGHLVVGKLDSSCEGAIWAHSPNAAVTVLASKPTSGELKDKVEDAFRGLPGHAQIQKDFESYKSSGIWSQGGTNVTTYEGVDRKVILAWAATGDGCGDFLGEFWAAYEVSSDGNLVLLSDPKNPGEIAIPRAAALIDGELTFLSDNVQIRKVGTVWRRTADATAPYFDCPC